MVHGSLAYSCSQMAVKLCRKFGFVDSVGKACEDFCLAVELNIFKEEVADNLDDFEEDIPSARG